MDYRLIYGIDERYLDIRIDVTRSDDIRNDYVVVDHEAIIEDSEETISDNEYLTENVHDRTLMLEDLEKFSNEFRETRLEMGLTQEDVSLSMRKIYGRDISQTTISRFEKLNISFTNMCKLKPFLEEWLSNIVRSSANGKFSRDALRVQLASMNDDQGDSSVARQRRRKRTLINGLLLQVLEEVFLTNAQPSLATLKEIADTVNMDYEVMKVWFCNRRQKMRRTDPNVVFHEEPPGAIERFRMAAIVSGLRVPPDTNEKLERSTNVEITTNIPVPQPFDHVSIPQPFDHVSIPQPFDHVSNARTPKELPTKRMPIPPNIPKKLGSVRVLLPAKAPLKKSITVMLPTKTALSPLLPGPVENSKPGSTMATPQLHRAPSVLNGNVKVQRPVRPDIRVNGLPSKQMTLLTKTTGRRK